MDQFATRAGSALVPGATLGDLQDDVEVDGAALDSGAEVENPGGAEETLDAVEDDPHRLQRGWIGFGRGLLLFGEELGIEILLDGVAKRLQDLQQTEPQGDVAVGEGVCQW